MRRLLVLWFAGTTFALHAGHATRLPTVTPQFASRQLVRSRGPLAVQQTPPREDSDFVLPLRVRRWLYTTLLPLDKGDFRWEFLVPFNNKTLTTVDKFIVCSTFIGLSFSVQTVADPGASVGVHLSYICLLYTSPSPRDS